MMIDRYNKSLTINLKNWMNKQTIGLIYSSKERQRDCNRLTKTKLHKKNPAFDEEAKI